MQATAAMAWRDGDRPAHWDHELIGPEREAALLALARDGDRAARDELVLSKQRLVVAMAAPYAGGVLGLDDLVSAGNKGLILAIDRYDPARGETFTTYATASIRGRIWVEVEDLRRLVRIPRWLWSVVRDYRGAARRLGLRRDDPEAFGPACDALGLGTRRRESLRLALRTLRDAPEGGLGFGRDDPREPACEPDCGPGAAEAVERLLATLRPDYAQLIRDRHGIGPGEPLTQREIARRDGTSSQAVQQREARAMAALRWAAGRWSA